MNRAALDAIISPFQGLRELLHGLTPGAAPIDMTIGEPRHGMPRLAMTIIRQQEKNFGKYPPVSGIEPLRHAIVNWLQRRYPVLQGRLDADRHAIPLNGSREGLFSALFIAKAIKPIANPAVLMPNPFYQAYQAAALACGCEPVFLASTSASGFLPCLEAIPNDLDRCVAFYLASPSNPEGAIAGPDYLRRLVELARRHGFTLFSDECYSEIYRDEAPTSALEAAIAHDGNFRQVLIFNSLSKRSSAPGLRSGFAAGDPEFLSLYLKFRNVACPQIPTPVQQASAALWEDEGHVERSRLLYRQKFEKAQNILGGKAWFSLSQGGFFLWLDLTEFGGGLAAAKTFWKGYGVKILPGAMLARPDRPGHNPGAAYARLALVDSLDVTEEAFERLAALP